MAPRRPADTYRAARRRVGMVFIRLSGSNWKRPFDDKLIKLRPVLARGWDYSKGGREKFDSVREAYSVAKKQYRQLMREGA